MQNVRLSICIPTYNFGEFIGETLQSIIEQAGDGVEIVVGDGASTDDTAEVVKKYQAAFEGLVYRNFGKKGGVDVDLAKTVALAKGEYCWLLSADDIVRPKAISKMLSELELRHTIYLCNRVDCDRSLNELVYCSWLDKRYGNHIFDFSNNAELKEYLEATQRLGALFSYISSIVVRRQEWEDAKPDEMVIGSNYAHVQRLLSIAKKGGKVKYIAEALVAARGFNDSFAIKGIARRYMIDLDGYRLIADLLFEDQDVKDRIKAVMRKEHKWYFLASLRNKVNKGEWKELEHRLIQYGYSEAKLNIVSTLGRSSVVLGIIRYIKGMFTKVKFNMFS